MSESTRNEVESLLQDRGTLLRRVEEILRLDEALHEATGIEAAFILTSPINGEGPDTPDVAAARAVRGAAEAVKAQAAAALATLKSHVYLYGTTVELESALKDLQDEEEGA